MPHFLGRYLRPEVTRFVILFIERDGSTYLTGLLDSHPNIVCQLEKFAMLKQKEATWAEQQAWADELFTPPVWGQNAAIGFKTKLVDVLDLEGFRQQLRHHNVHVIHMRRRNRIKAVISRINARRLYEATGKWNLYNESDRMPPMEITRDVMAEFLKEREDADAELDAFVASLGLPSTLVVYEELLVNKDQVLDGLQRFLKVKPVTLQGKTLKHTSDDLRDVVLNLDELKSIYAGTPYHGMFDEVLEA